MRKTVTMHERIAARAYFAWLNGPMASAEANWLEAEAIETALAERRAASARKAAETRKAKAPVTNLTMTNRRTRAAVSYIH